MDKIIVNLSANGCNIEEALNRLLQDRSLYYKFLCDFKKDENFYLLKNALINGEMDSSILYAHTLKGLCANLGFEKIMILTVELLNILKSKSNKKYMDVFNEIEENYLKICDILNEIN